MMRGHRQWPVAQRDGSNCQQWLAVDWKLTFPQRLFALSIFSDRIQAELVGRVLAILRIGYLRPFSFLLRVAWLDPLSVFPQRRQTMRLQLAASDCSDNGVVSIVLVESVLCGNLLHQFHRNLFEMCLGLLH